MSDKQTSKLATAAAPHLRPGEVVEIGAFTTVGSVSVKRQVLTAAAVGIATGGMVAATVRPARRYLAVTSQRLLFFNGEGTYGRPGKLLFSVPRDAVDVTKSGKRMLSYRIEVAITGQEKGLRINFAFNARAKMEQVAALLSAASSSADNEAAPQQEAQQA
ncbi:MAG TPA: hypothetical protein VMU95_19815 [Trebonia sp.]|nr:hypothetical protein [Trebonia sp.]